jgi:excisionase family DNA binding protein
MAELQMLFPMEPEEFWKQLRVIVDEAIVQHNRQAPINPVKDNSQRLLKAKEVCAIFKISKPTLYEWMDHGKIFSIKIGSRRFFESSEVDALIERSKQK